MQTCSIPNLVWDNMLPWSVERLTRQIQPVMESQAAPLSCVGCIDSKVPWMGTISPLSSAVSSSAALALCSAPLATLCRLLLLRDGCLNFAFEGLCRIQLVEMGISNRISQAELTAESQWLVQRCPLL